METGGERTVHPPEVLQPARDLLPVPDQTALRLPQGLPPVHQTGLPHQHVNPRQTYHQGQVRVTMVPAVHATAGAVPAISVEGVAGAVEDLAGAVAVVAEDVKTGLPGLTFYLAG